MRVAAPGIERVPAPGVFRQPSDARARRATASASAESRSRGHPRSSSEYLCSFSISAGRDTPRRRAVSLWFFPAASNSAAMIDRSKPSTRARSGWLGPGSLDSDSRALDGVPASSERHKREREPIVLGERQQPRHRVLELAHVARPRVGLERLDQRGLDLDGAHAVAIGVRAHERVHERLDVLGALAQRRNADGNDVEPIEQVFAESTGLGLGGEIAVRRDDEADVDVLGAAADGLHLAGLDDAQDLRLHRQRQLADLVDEERALVGLLEVTEPRRMRARERALHVTEQLGLGELGGNGGGVEADERLVGALRVRVERRGEHVLADAALSGEQHGDVLGGDARDDVEHAPEGRALRDDRPSQRRLGAEPRVLETEDARVSTPRFTASTSSSGSNGFGM